MEPRARIEAYFQACSEGSAAEVASHFTDDAVVYDMNHQPVRGAETIGSFWTKIRSKWDAARWLVHTCVADGNEAAIEWSMVGKSGERDFCVRGSEHYAFVDTKIAEIRQYWHFDPKVLDSELQGYPYQTDPRFSGSVGS